MCLLVVDELAGVLESFSAFWVVAGVFLSRNLVLEDSGVISFLQETF